MQIVYDKKCKCFTQRSYEKRAGGVYHKFIGADPFSETTPPAFVVKLLFSLTGGSPNVLDALAKIAAHIFMTENLARHISVLHCESLANISILLQLLAKEHERMFPLADLCKSEKLFTLIEAKANDAYYNISISTKACTAVMAGKLEDSPIARQGLLQIVLWVVNSSAIPCISFILQIAMQKLKRFPSCVR